MNNELILRENQELDLINYNEWKEKQVKILEENPFVKIVDNASYQEAKKTRTNLVSARTEVEKQDKIIASKIKELRVRTQEITAELISITKPSEENQQKEVKRYEAEKEAEKQEKKRLEEERIKGLQKNVNDTVEVLKNKISLITYQEIETLEPQILEEIEKVDSSVFQELSSVFDEKAIELKTSLANKISLLKENEAQRVEKLRMEEERKRLDEENAKLAKLKAEQEAEAEKAKAEQKRIQEELEKERKAIEAEKKRLQDEENAKLAKLKAEQEAEAEKARLESLLPDIDAILFFLININLGKKPRIRDKELARELDIFVESINKNIEDYKQKYSEHI